MRRRGDCRRHNVNSRLQSAAFADVHPSSVTVLIAKFDKVFSALAKEFNADWPRCNREIIQACEEERETIDAIFDDFFDRQVTMANDIIRWLSTGSDHLKYLILDLEVAAVRVQMCSFHRCKHDEVNKFICTMNKRLDAVKSLLAPDSSINFFGKKSLVDNAND